MNGKMTDAERLAKGAAVCRALGAYWRHDWSDFDGRTLRLQLADIACFLEGGPEVSEDEYAIQ
jgi:hypothetical protein